MTRKLPALAGGSSPNLHVGSMWPIESTKENPIIEWWKEFTKPEYDKLSNGDLCVYISKILKDWVLEGHASIDTSDAPKEDLWCVSYPIEKQTNRIKHIDQIAVDFNSCQLHIGVWSKADNVKYTSTTGNVRLIHVIVHFHNETSKEYFIPCENGTRGWEYKEQLIDIDKELLVSHIEIHSGCTGTPDATEAEGTLKTTGLEVKFNTGNKNNPHWTKNYAPVIGPANYWDYFLCIDAEKAKQEGSKDAWRDYDMPIGIQYINGHHGHTIEIYTGDIEEGSGDGPETKLWFTRKRVEQVPDVKDTKALANENKNNISSNTTSINGICSGTKNILSINLFEDKRVFNKVSDSYETKDEDSLASGKGLNATYNKLHTEIENKTLKSYLTTFTKTNVINNDGIVTCNHRLKISDKYFNVIITNPNGEYSYPIIKFIDTDNIQLNYKDCMNFIPDGTYNVLILKLN